MTSVTPGRSGHTRSEWATQIGRFMLCFGDLEHSLAVLVTRIAKDEIDVTVAKMSFDFRLGFLEDLVEPYGFDNDHPLQLLVKELRALNDKRNMVAHNAIYFFPEDDPANDYIALVSLRNANKRLKFDELLSLSERAERAVSRILIPIEGLRIGLKINEVVWPRIN